jgi:hypothetical protein
MDYKWPAIDYMHIASLGDFKQRRCPCCDDRGMCKACILEQIKEKDKVKEKDEGPQKKQKVDPVPALLDGEGVPLN